MLQRCELCILSILFLLISLLCLIFYYYYPQYQCYFKQSLLYICMYIYITSIWIIRGYSLYNIIQYLFYLYIDREALLKNITSIYSLYEQHKILSFFSFHFFFQMNLVQHRVQPCLALSVDSQDCLILLQKYRPSLFIFIYRYLSNLCKSSLCILYIDKVYSYK